MSRNYGGLIFPVLPHLMRVCRHPVGSSTQRSEPAVAAAAAGSLQPSGVLAAASALAAAAAAGFTGGPASSTIIAAGKAGTVGQPASSSLVAGPVSAAGGSGTPGMLCSGEVGASGSSAGLPAAWQMQVEQQHLQGSSSGNSTMMHAAHILQQHRSSRGGNDTVQSGIDCTPRSAQATVGSASSISTAAPMVVSGSIAVQAGIALQGVQPAATGMDGGSSGSATALATPRAMETDTPGCCQVPVVTLKTAAGNALKLSTGLNVVASSNAAMQQQQQQQQAPLAVAAHQRHSSGGLDVLATGGNRGQADQATLVATGSPVVKLQPGSSHSTTAAAGAGYAPAAGAEGKGLVSNAVAAFLAQQKQQQQQQHQQYAADSGTWAPAHVAAEPKQHVQDMAGSNMNSSVSYTQQAYLLQQQLLMQQQIDMSVVGQGVGQTNNASKQQQPQQPPQQQLGSVLMDRLLPRLQH